MKKNVDILLGLVACVIALLTFASEFFLNWSYESQWKEWIAPILWILCVIGMYVFKSRSSWKLIWVWLSFPFAFIVWLFFGLLFWAWSNGAAP